ncbi:DUF6958 family protein [Ohtaekwangia sp.]|uniref:DUF6958 family protein n=1 Tax=Ohtaekwangia sp. TaxID=2066019 RepID=UPI002F928FAD
MKSEMVTLRPDGRKGITMTESYYKTLATYILSALDTEEPITLNTLLEKALKDFTDSIDSDITWYVLQVKLDLEARSFIRTVTPPYRKRLFLLKLTRQGQKRLQHDRLLADWPHN